jgi:hypothetical protein
MYCHCNKSTHEALCFDDGPYRIPCELNEKLTAKSILEELDRRGKILIIHLLGNYPNTYISKNLKNRYNTDSIRETHPLETEDTSYTLNKGQIISVCLRKDDGTFHDIELLMYVFIHELAHIAENDDQHTDNFWNTYIFMLDRAYKIGIYTPIDYSLNPVEYCGKMMIDFNLYLE